MSQLQSVNLTMDEFEAIRLADLERLYHERAAEQMNVSRQTFGRILDSAHEKIAEILAYGKALTIEGGDVQMTGNREFKCYACEHTWELAFGTGRPDKCPECGSTNFHRIDQQAGAGGGGGGKGRSGGRGGGGGGGMGRGGGRMQTGGGNTTGSGGGQARGKQCGIKIEEKRNQKDAS